MLGQHIISQLDPVVQLLTHFPLSDITSAVSDTHCLTSSMQRSHTRHNALQVQLSNHTGYPSWTGSVMEGQQLAELLKGLQANGLTSCTHLLTGKQVPYCCEPQIKPACPLHCPSSCPCALQGTLGQYLS